MNELMDQIKIELFRTENKLATNYRIFNYSRKDLKIEIKEEVFHNLHGEMLTRKIYKVPEDQYITHTTIFGVPLEVKKELKKDFIIYIDSSILN